MEPSKVFFTNLRVTDGRNLLDKLLHLVKKAGIESIDFSKKFTAIKLHFGEPGNLSFVRPNYAKVLVDLVRNNGGMPYLTDCNTLYVGRRKNALDHIDAAYENGFSPFSTGCHVIIGDGLKGTDETLIKIPGDYVKEAKIGRAIMDADVFISLTHFKGHEGTGFGGAIKNIGMGCGSRAGKMEMHNSGKPEVDEDLCVHCGKCRKECAHDAITFPNKKARINWDKCVGCGRCIGACPEDAIHPTGDQHNDILNMKIAEYSLAVLQGRPHFHVSLVMDISPACDCHDYNDAPILPDVGMFASFDPVALDQACVDACLKQQPLPGSKLSETPHISEDHFRNSYPETNWLTQLTHGEKLGLGTRAYELIEV
jgi:uncharacterized Fe-S center protein